MDGTSPEGSTEAPAIETLQPETAPPTIPPPAPKPLRAVALAGLQAGMLGVLWMLAWLGVSAAWQQDSFWKSENLFATVFYGGGAYRAGSGFVHSTFAGLSLFLVIYSLLGACFAIVVRDRLSPVKTLFSGVLFGALWYYLSFRLLWKSIIPLAFLLHSETPTLLGHLVYGTFLGRFPVYLRDPSRIAAVVKDAQVVDQEGTRDGVPAIEPAAAAPAPTEATPVPDQFSSPPGPA